MTSLSMSGLRRSFQPSFHQNWSSVGISAWPKAYQIIRYEFTFTTSIKTEYSWQCLSHHWLKCHRWGFFRDMFVVIIEFKIYIPDVGDILGMIGWLEDGDVYVCMVAVVVITLFCCGFREYKRLTTIRSISTPEIQWIIFLVHINTLMCYRDETREFRMGEKEGFIQPSSMSNSVCLTAIKPSVQL